MTHSDVAELLQSGGKLFMLLHVHAQDMAQEEADAVAALMAAASGDIRSEAAADADDQSPPGRGP